MTFRILPTPTSGGNYFGAALTAATNIAQM
jgi:hypothetical protein